MVQTRKVVHLGLDTSPYRLLWFRAGKVLGRTHDGQQQVVCEPGILAEPDTIYFIDDDGDLAGHVKEPPLAHGEVTWERVVPALDVKFFRLPFEGPAIHESEVLAPDVALQAWGEAGRAAVISSSRLRASDAVDVVREAVDVKQLFARRRRALEDTFDDVDAQAWDLERAQLASWRGDARYQFQDAGAGVVLHLVDCPPAELPLWLGLGGFTAGAPSAAELAAVLAYWGSECTLLANGRDHLELHVAPHADRRRLAWEQYLLADDVCYQGPRVVSAMANDLASGRMLLWWD